MTRDPWPLRACASAERMLERAEDRLRAGELARGTAMVLAAMVLSAGLWLVSAFMLALGRE